MRYIVPIAWATLATLTSLACHPRSEAARDVSGAGNPVGSMSTSTPAAAWRTAVRPEVLGLVEALEKHPRVESKQVGEGGEPSAAYEAFENLRTKATSAELHAIASHQNPVVRSYVGIALVESGDSSSELRTLQADTSTVQVLMGCRGGERTVATVIASGL